MDLLGGRGLRESGVCNVDAAMLDLGDVTRRQHVAPEMFRLAQFATWLPNASNTVHARVWVSAVPGSVKVPEKPTACPSSAARSGPAETFCGAIPGP